MEYLKIEATCDFEKNLLKKVVNTNKKIVLPEGDCDRIINAAKICAANNICEVILLVEDINDDRIQELKNMSNVTIIDYKNHELKPVLASALYVERKAKGITEEDAKKLIENPVYFAAMMVKLGLADGYACGATTTTAMSLKPALQIIKSKSGVVSSYFIMEKEGKTFGFGDCGLIENPTEDELVAIAENTANAYNVLCGNNPIVAMLSYSTMGSAKSESVTKVANAVAKLKSKNLSYVVDGEMQLDAAVCEKVAKLKAPKSEVKGNANVLIFPNLESGNIGYKIMQRFGGYKAYGPLCAGFNKPVNDISRGANVQEIVYIVAITALQCVEEDK